MKSSNEHERRPWRTGESQTRGNDARSSNPRQGTGSRGRARASASSQDVFRDRGTHPLHVRKERARERVHRPALGSCLRAATARTRPLAKVCPRNEPVCILPHTTHRTSCNSTGTTHCNLLPAKRRRAASSRLEELEDTLSRDPKRKKSSAHPKMRQLPLSRSTARRAELRLDGDDGMQLRQSLHGLASPKSFAAETVSSAAPVLPNNSGVQRCSETGQTSPTFLRKVKVNLARRRYYPIPSKSKK